MDGKKLPSKKLPFEKRLRITLLVSICLVGFGGLYLFWKVDSIHGKLNTIHRFYVPLIKELNLIQGKWVVYERSFEQLVSFRRWGAVTGQKSRRAIPKPNLQKMLDHELTEIDHVLLLKSFSDDMIEIKQLRDWLPKFREILEQENQNALKLLTLVRDRKFHEAGEIYSKIKQQHVAINLQIEVLGQVVENRMAVSQIMAEHELQSAEVWMLILVVFALVVSIVVLNRIHRWFAPVEALTKVAQEISLKGLSGDVKFPSLKQMPEEVELLTREFGRMGTTVLEREKTIHQQKSKLEALNHHLKLQGLLNERILNNMSAGALLLDESGKIEQINKRFLELFDLTWEKAHSEVLGKNILDALEFFPKTHVASWLELKESKKERITSHRRYFDIRVQPLDPPRGRLLFFEDVTDLVEAQEKLAHVQKLVLAGQMSAQVAHELRNPLNSMVLQLEMLEEDLAFDFGDGLEKQKRIKNILDQVTRLDRITQKYLNVNRPEASKKEVISIHELIEKCLLFYAKEIQSNGIELFFDATASDFMVYGSADELSQVLFNLLRNSIEALRGVSSPKIKISTDNEQGKILVRVEDNGRGVSKDLEAKLFEPFVTDKPTGHGLGLSVSRQICIDHGGELKYQKREFESRLENRGAVFEVTLHTRV
ncbi:MAG: PAS domain-containing sensor histidine kinase [Bacteriovoracia bacterium]